MPGEGSAVSCHSWKGRKDSKVDLRKARLPKGKGFFAERWVGE